MVAGEPTPEFAVSVMAHVTGEAERKLLAQIDAGVAATVAGEPSPQFAAAVRGRIAAEPAPRRTWFSFGWWVPAAGAVAGAVLLALVLQETPVPPRGVPTAVINSVDPPVRADVPVVVTKVPNKRRTAPGRPRIVAPEETTLLVAAKAEMPEVLILPEERHVAGFYRFVREGRLNAAQVLLANRIELAVLLGEMQTPSLVRRGSEVKTLDLVDSVRSTSDSVSNK